MKATTDNGVDFEMDQLTNEISEIKTARIETLEEIIEIKESRINSMQEIIKDKDKTIEVLEKHIKLLKTK